MSCGHYVQDEHAPRSLAQPVNVPPQPESTPVVRRRNNAKPSLDIQEPKLTKTLQKYCDLRRRAFTQDVIRTKLDLTRQQANLLIDEAAKRDMPGSQETQSQAIQEWLLEMHDSGSELSVIQRMSALTDEQTKNRLKAALDAASGPAPTDLIIMDIQGNPTRVSWLDVNGELKHRPFDGAFPAGYPADLALRQCTEVLYRLISYPNNSVRDRAYTMLSMAEVGLHSFDYDSGRWVNAELERAGLDEDAKHTVIMKLHPHPSVGKLLLQRCGKKSKWLTGNRARLMSRRLRDYEFSPAFIRDLLEHIGVDPNTYYAIGPDYRIPEPSQEEKDQCIQSLQEIGFPTQHIQSALSTLGVPPGGRHPPKRKSQKNPPRI